MAAHTPVIGLTGIVREFSEEWRVSGRDCGLRELVKVVVGWTEVGERGGVTAPSQKRPERPRCDSASCEVKDNVNRQVKGDNNTTSRVARSPSTGFITEGMFSQSLQALPSQLARTRPRSSVSSRANHTRHPTHCARSGRICQAYSALRAPAVWAQPHL